MRQYYASRGIMPKNILLREMPEDAEALGELLYQLSGRKVSIEVPQRGERLRLVERAEMNASEEILRATTVQQRRTNTLIWLQKSLELPEYPERIEAFDVSNLGDTGIVAIYFSCDHDNTDHCIELIEGELGRLQTTPLSARRLSMAKKQFIAQLAISMESNEGYMLGAGKSFLAHREVDTMEEVYRKIQALTAEDLTAVASSVFSSPSRLIYK